MGDSLVTNTVRIFYTSDSHFDHLRVLQFSGRPFWCLTHMHREFIRRWNKVVGPDDVVIHLGDISWSNNMSFLKKMNGRKILVAGNHDSCHAMHKGKRMKKFLEFFDEVHSELRFRVVDENGEFTTLIHNHLPHESFHRDDRRNNHFLSYRPKLTPGAKEVVICGHVHEAWLKKGPNVNVGVDAWEFAPVSLQAVLGVASDPREMIPTPHPSRRRLWSMIHKILGPIQRVIRRIVISMRPSST